MKKNYFLLIVSLFVLQNAKAQFSNASLQIVHNSPDTSIQSVDLYVYLNTFPVSTLTDIQFRTTTANLTIIAGQAISIEVKKSPSTASSPVLATLDAGPFIANQHHIVVANGILSGSTGYADAQPFTLDTYTPALQTGTSFDSTNFLFHNGALGMDDFTVYDVYQGIGNTGFTKITNAIPYRSFDGYHSLYSDNQYFQLRNADGDSVLSEYGLYSYFLNNRPLTVLSSGFINPAQNNNGANFGLFYVPNSSGNLIPLTTRNISTARTQIIHNAPDVVAANLDIWVNNTKVAPSLMYRNATPFIDVFTGNNVISVQQSNSTDTIGAIFTKTVNFAPNDKKISVINGILSATGYNPNRDFDIFTFQNAKEKTGDSLNSELLFFNGSTDLSADALVENENSTSVFGASTSYASFSNDFETLNSQKINLKSANNSFERKYGYSLVNLNMKGKTGVLLTSGFEDPSNNNNGIALSLYLVKSEGGPFIELPDTNVFVGSQNVLNKNNDFDVYPNPAQNIINISSNNINTKNIIIYNYAGKLVYSETFNQSNEIKINTESLSNGVYFLQIIENGTNIGTEKIIINK
jgi:hypothetical protein